MTNFDLVRSWKDPDHRPASFDPADHPSGSITLPEMTGGQAEATAYVLTLGCCHGFTNNTCLSCVPATCNGPCADLTSFATGCVVF